MAIFASHLIESVECPKCGKHTVVRQSEHHYLCLNCDFQRDLSPPLAHFLEMSTDSSRLIALRNPDESFKTDMHPIIFVAMAVLFGFFVT
jgi:hypothetical protein